MTINYIDWGGEVVDPGSEELGDALKGIIHACQDNPSCEFVELRRDINDGTQTLVVDVGDGSFEINNPAGINRVERLAISYIEARKFCWEVRALREDFPLTIHQNHVLKGQPRSLCLYIEPWEAVERTWTPNNFLNRIFWWLRATAEGTIHTRDQPIEQLFFDSPISVILPEGYFGDDNYKKRKLVFQGVSFDKNNVSTLIGSYLENESEQGSVIPKCIPISLILEPIENGPIEEFPYMLGELSERLSNRGVDLVNPLKLAIRDLATEEGIKFSNESREFVLINLGIPRVRDGVQESIDIQGFVIDSEISRLGECLSVLFRSPIDRNLWYRELNTTEGNDSWKEISIFPATIKTFPSNEDIRKFSNIHIDDEGPKGIIAGVGALGGLLGQIWQRECWGEWYYVDDDIVQPHNVARHIASHNAVGFPKSDVVDAIVNGIHSHRGSDKRHFVSKIISDNVDLKNLIEQVDLLVDSTTTLHVPRNLSLQESCPRIASIFFTPSGMSSVMLLENLDRSIRCNHLEGQYYRALLNNEFGKCHLTGHYGGQWIGAGCRQLTNNISNELVHLHVGNLSRQLRKAYANDKARIAIWEYIEDTGELISHETPVFKTYKLELGQWEVVLDCGLIASTQEYRRNCLPNETGGILFGVVDQKDKTIILVKAAFAPEGSVETPDSFLRAAYETTELLDETHERTAGVVTYIGEWHSHPKGFAALPSGHDINQHSFVTNALHTEGVPALMMILSDTSIGCYLGGEGVIFDTTSINL